MICALSQDIVVVQSGHGRRRAVGVSLRRQLEGRVYATCDRDYAKTGETMFRPPR